MKVRAYKNGPPEEFSAWLKALESGTPLPELQKMFETMMENPENYVEIEVDEMKFSPEDEGE